MSESLRIVIAEDESRLLQDLCELVTRFGHEVVAAVSDGQSLVQQCAALNPDLVITDIKMPRLGGLDAAAKLRESHPVPIIIISEHHDQELTERALEQHVMAYLSKPVTDVDLQTAIALATRRFRELQAIRAECADLKQSLSNRKLIERAKGMPDETCLSGRRRRLFSTATTIVSTQSKTRRNSQNGNRRRRCSP